MPEALTGLGDLLVGTLTSAVGVVALLLALLRRGRADPLLTAFGAFALLYGCRLVVGNPLNVRLGITPQVASWITAGITYLVNVPAWLFFWQLLGGDRKSLVLKWLVVTSSFATVGIVFDLIQRRPGTLAGAPNNIVVLIGLVVVVLALTRHRGRMTEELKIVIVGLTVFGAFALNENLVPLGWLPWTWQEESIGFLFFVGCLGYVAARRFFETEGQLAALESELETARQIQVSLLPEQTPDSDEFSVAVRFRPTSAVAGDFYEFLRPTPDAVGILVADVSGHGVPAALIASMVKVATSSHAEFAAQPAEFFGRINRTLCGTVRRGFVTAAYLYLDVTGREMLVASAGHPPPLLIPAGAEPIIEIGGQGPLLGRFPDAQYRQQSIPLQGGERIALFTDGLLEACGRGSEQVGDARLRSWMSDARRLDIEAFCDRLIARLREWTGSRELELEDDLTVLAVDFRRGRPAGS